MAVVSLGDLKSWLKVTTTADDTLITDLEGRAVAFIERKTGRFFGASGTSHTEYLEGNGTDALWLKEAADAVTTVDERTQPGEAWSAILSTDSDGWELRGRRLLRKGGSVWTAGNEYRVIYDFGYATDQAPEEIKQLVRDLVKLKYDERTTNLALARDAVGSESYARAAFTGDITVLPWVRQTIDLWSDRKVG